MATIVTEGEWVLPSRPDLPMPGVLRVEGEQVSLTLIGRLPLAWEFAKSRSHPEMLLGLTTSGSVTLFHCSFSSSLERLGGAKSTTIRASFLLWGIHTRTPAEAIPVEIWVRYTSLENWLGQEAVFADFGKAVAGELRRPLASYRNTLVATPELEIEAVLHTTVKESERKLNLEDRNSIVFRSTRQLPVLDYLPFIAIFRRLLILATSSQVDVTALTAVFARESSGDCEIAGRHVPVSVRGMGILTDGDREPVAPHKLLFSLPTLGENASRFVGRWFEQFERFEAVITLYGFTAHRRDIIVEESFLNAVKACESYHRSAFGQAPSEKHEDRLREIIEAAPPRHRKWLKGQLHRAHEPRLQERLENLWRFAGEGITRLLPIDGKTCIEKTAAARNFLTHFSEEARGHAPSMSELPSLARWWLIILEACLLLNSGLGRSLVNEWFHRNHQLNRERFFEWRDVEYRPC